MSKENKRFVIFIIILFLSVLLSYPIPHRSLSTIQFLIPAIRYGNSRIYISGIIVIILFLIGVTGAVSSKRFNKNKILFGIIITLIVPSVMIYTLDLTRASYHTIKNDTVHSVDISQSRVSINNLHNAVSFNITLELKNYNFRPNTVKIRFYLPNTFSLYTKTRSIEFPESYIIRGLNETLSINESFKVDVTNDNSEFFTDSNWTNENLRYELYDANTSSTYIKYFH